MLLPVWQKARTNFFSKPSLIFRFVFQDIVKVEAEKRERERERIGLIEMLRKNLRVSWKVHEIVNLRLVHLTLSEVAGRGGGARAVTLGKKIIKLEKKWRGEPDRQVMTVLRVN